LEPNPDQLQAVNHGSGPLLIIAGAGTGKTRMLIGRLASLISGGARPERLMLLTFTRRAAEEMIQRCEAVIPVSARQVWAGTLHSVANRVLRNYGMAWGMHPNFTVIDRADSEDLMDLVRNELGYSTIESRFPRKTTCLDIYSCLVNGGGGLADVVKSRFSWCANWQDELGALFKAYTERKQSVNVLDYDDLLLYWSFRLEDDRAAWDLDGKFDHILVNEYQDTNSLQSGILMAMRRRNTNITAVGDDAQSIYSFRAATVRNMLDFPEHFPGATVVTRVLEHYEQGIPFRRQAVLFRAGSHSNSLELELARRNIPFRKYGGLRFLEAAHVKDLVCFLRVLENPRDEVAWFRVLQLINGFGPVTAAATYRHLAAGEFSLGTLKSFDPPSAARAEYSTLEVLLGELSLTSTSGPASRIERILPFYRRLSERRYENVEPRLRDLEQLAQLASGHDSTEQFLTDLTLNPPQSTGDLAGPPMRDEDWLVLSTIHSAKGLEWDAVYLIHAADGFLPSDMATENPEKIDEEPRLAYVAMTRARDFLYVAWPLRYHHRPSKSSDAHGYAQLSRFITDNVRATMEEEAYGLPEIQREAIGPAGPLSQSVAARLRSLWES
jgi:DNA helicase-2/ATP-dependent DNA helicase PcrA